MLNMEFVYNVRKNKLLNLYVEVKVCTVSVECRYILYWLK